MFPVWLLEGQIERKCQNRISKGNSELTGAQWVPSRAVLAYGCPKRPNMGQIGPRDIGADLDFGADLALSILHCACCKSHTHAANIKFQPNACSSCFKQNFPCLLGGENIYIITLLNTLPVLIILLNSLPVLVASVKDTLGETLVYTFVHNKYFPARWVSRKLSPKS